MDNAKLLERLIGIFLVELDDHVRTLNENLVALEKSPGANERVDVVKHLFRAAHSLKGAARSVSIKPIETVCHHLEEILLVAQERGVLDAGHFERCYATADALADAGRRLRADQTLAGSLLAMLNAQIEAEVRAGNANVIEPARPVPVPPAELDVHPSPSGRDATLESVMAAAAGAAPGLDGAEAIAVQTSVMQWPNSIETAVALANPAAPTTDADDSPNRPVPAETPHDGGSVRIAVRKLDAFISHHGQVLVLRGRMAARLETLGGLHDLVDQWKNEWHAVEKLIVGLHGEEIPGGAGRSAQARRCAPILRRTGDNLGRLERDLGRLVASLAEDERALTHASSGLDSDVSRIRMLPFGEACQGLDRTVRDLAHSSGKEVDLVIAGSRIEIDRAILEGLRDPLTHLVRNAVDHGVEPAADRVAAGKSRRARIEVSAVLRGAQIEVSVDDDGRGLNMEAIRAKARRSHFDAPADDAQAAELIFVSGFSTAGIITEVSGRGVGLDAVKDKIEAMRGAVNVSWQEGRGARFVLTTPLTLTTVRAVVLRAGGQTFAMDGSAIRRMVHVRPEEIRSFEGREMMFLHGDPVPLISLAHTLGIRAQNIGAAATGATAVVLATGDRQVAFVVDQLLAEQPLVVKTLGARLRRLRCVSGAAMMPDGQVVLILNPADLIRGALARTAGELAPATFGAQVIKKRILVTDDSVTSRTMMQSMLEAAGYDVTVTVDGADAWEVLQERGTDLVVSDVEMPRMDGLALTEIIRHSSQFRDLPIVLVTARATDQDKTSGMEAGANAYLVKSTFDQQGLLDVVAQLL